jgi:hypothetical protein
VRALLLLVVLALPASARQVPFYLRALNTQRDVAGINENFRTLADGLLPLDGGSTVSCTGSQVILAPIYANGVLQSGTCAANGSGGTTVTTASPISGDGSGGSPVTLTGAVPVSLVDLSTVPRPGSCSLPNVVTATNAGAAPTCSQPSNVTGSAASVTGSVNAGQIVGGPLASSVLPSTVPYTSVANQFTAAQDIRTVSSSMTVQGNAFSVGGSSFTVAGGSITAAYQAQAGSFKANNITGSAQCVHADTTGILTGTGSDCGSGGGGGTSPSPQTRQTFTSGSGTYNTPSGATSLLVRMVGGGGAGGCNNAAEAPSGSNTTFNSITSYGGKGGSQYNASTQLGFGGSSTTASGVVFSVKGGDGSIGSGSSASQIFGGSGGNSVFGGGGVGCNNTQTPNGGYDGAINTGAGGGGGCSTGGAGSQGGGAGGYVEYLIDNPAASYSYSVGAGGSKPLSCSQGVGGAGSTGTITVTEFYNSVPVAGSVGFRQKNFLDQVNGSKKAFTLPESASSSPTVVLDGLLQSGTSDYTWDGGATITMTTAPASNSSSFFVLYTVNTSTLAAAMLINSTDTVSGAKTFLSTITVTNLVYGTTDNLLNVPQGAILAKSIDGATQSTGCIVAVSVNSSGSNAETVFTSTTTNLVPVNVGITAGVLLDPCAPGQICRVGTLTGSIYRVNVGAMGGSGRWCGFHSTRCQVECNETTGSFVIGKLISNGGAAVTGMQWMVLSAAN